MSDHGWPQPSLLSSCPLQSGTQRIWMTLFADTLMTFVVSMLVVMAASRSRWWLCWS